MDLRESFRGRKGAWKGMGKELKEGREKGEWVYFYVQKNDKSAVMVRINRDDHLNAYQLLLILLLENKPSRTDRPD